MCKKRIRIFYWADPDSIFYTKEYPIHDVLINSLAAIKQKTLDFKQKYV